MPTLCRRDHRSFSTTRARMTVLAGYNDANTAATASDPLCAAATYRAFAPVSNKPASNTQCSDPDAGRHSPPLAAISTSISPNDPARATTSGQNTAEEPANFINSRNAPKPTPAAIASPNPSDAPPAPLCDAINQMLTSATA